MSAQTAAPKKLNLVIVEGEGAINNIRQRTAREPIVQVEDENRKPIAGATVTFLLPRNGPGLTLPDGSSTFTTTTDANGRAVLRSASPNRSQGQFQVQVNASYQGLTASTVISQSNLLAAAAAAGISAKLIAVLAIVGGAAAAGTAIALTRDDGNGGTTVKPPVVVSPGTPSVGGPR